ncbi:MAG: hypothetical protein ACRYGR_04575 [Janthinobacterium lividum]
MVLSSISISISYGMFYSEEVIKQDFKSQNICENKFDTIPDEILKVILKCCLKHDDHLNQHLCFDQSREDTKILSHHNYFNLSLVNKRFNLLQQKVPYFTATRYSFSEPFDLREIQYFIPSFWETLNILNISVYSEFSDLTPLFENSFTNLHIVSLFNALSSNNPRTATNLFDPTIAQLTLFLHQNNKVYRLKISDFKLDIEHLVKFKNITHFAFSAHQLGLLELKFLLEEMPLTYLYLKNIENIILTLGDKKIPR